MFEHILFPVDFSPSCVAMAAYVQRAAAIFGAQVTLVHVCDLASHNGFELYARRPDQIAGDHWSLARTNLELFLKSEFPGTCPRLLLAGDAGGVIVETAKKGKFDLIIMPTHAGRFRRMLLGSTTTRVLNAAECPVLTTEHAATGGPRSLEHRHWVCGIGLSEDSLRVLRYAKNASLAAGAKLSVIHVIQTSKVKSRTRGPSEEEQRARQRIAELQHAVGSDASGSVAFGSVRKTLLQEVRQLSGDVLVIGRSAHGAGGRLEDLTYSLLRDSPCPVVSV
jgi:nucleotide-binding universal stress UspA family protein